MDNKEPIPAFRNVSFIPLTKEDDVIFYVDGKLICHLRNGASYNSPVRSDSAKITMAYGIKHHKKSSFVIPADGKAYVVLGGRPDNFYWLSCFQKEAFSDYIDSLYCDLINSGIKRWVKAYMSPSSQLELRRNKFIYRYVNGEYGALKIVRFSRKTKQLYSKIPKDAIKNSRDSGIGIYKIIRDRLRNDGINIKDDGSFDWMDPLL